MKCKECCNNIKGTCRTMREKPKDSWCFVTLDQAIKIESDCLSYALKHDPSNKYKYEKIYEQATELLMR